MNNEDLRTLKGVVIDPGHGGSDPGAIGNNRYEKDYTLKISKYMYDRLRELGIPVTLTRDTDVTLSPTDRVNAILSAYGNDPNVIVVSNHLNAGGGTGAEVIYALRNQPTFAQLILNNIGLTGQSTRRAYQKQSSTDPSKDYYFIHRNTGTIEPVIVEYGFIDDTTNNVDFLDNNYKELAESVIKSITDYKNIPYIPPRTPSQNTYTVKSGDTLYAIANKYNTTVDHLKKINNLTSNNLSIGQILKLSTTDQNTYTVKPGDTLYKIATKNNTNVQALKELNNLANDTLLLGQTLLLPTTEIIEIPTTNITYTVQKGDTLYVIAKKYDTTVDQIKKLNNLTTNTLSIGQILKIPTTEIMEIPSTTITYIVKPGDTLYSIAREYNTTVNNIKDLNNLYTNLISVGQTLLLPS